MISTPPRGLIFIRDKARTACSYGSSPVRLYLGCDGLVRQSKPRFLVEMKQEWPVIRDCCPSCSTELAGMDVIFYESDIVPRTVALQALVIGRDGFG